MAKEVRFNIQQQPKSKNYLKGFIAREGFKLVQLDFTSIEPVVLTMLSKDENLRRIYGPNVKPNDIYLFIASNISGLDTNIIKYYDADNPTKKGISEAKKKCKRDRGIAKTVHLAATYNAGPRKIRQTLKANGIELSLNEVETIYEGYWSLWSGVIQYKEDLYQEWLSNKGYIINIIGRPIAVAEKLTKDLLNRVCQSSGHDLLMMFIAKINALIHERQVTMYPWLVDFHDETIWEVPIENVDKAKEIFKDALRWLNSINNSDIPIKGDIIIADNLAQIKMED